MVEITQWPILIALFAQSVPPLAFVIAEQGGMPDRGAMLSPQILTIFPSNNLTPPERRQGVGWMAGQVGVGVVVRVG